MPMTSRDRVLTVLNHEAPDRVPIIIGVSNATGIKMDTYRQTKALTGIEALDEYQLNNLWWYTNNRIT